MALAQTMATHNNSMSFLDLPSNVQINIVTLSVQSLSNEALEFLGHRGSSPCAWAKNPMLPLLRTLSFYLPPVEYGVLEKANNISLYSTCRFDFVSSNVGESKKYVAACVVANNFFTHIGSWKISLMRIMYCDLDWTRREWTANEFFNMLGAMLVNPRRSIRDVDFKLTACNGATRSDKGLSNYRPRCFSLSGFISFTPNIFINRGSLQPWRQANQWIQQHRVNTSPFNTLVRLPREMSHQIYRHAGLVESHVVDPEILPNPSLGLLELARKMTLDLIPVLYDGCTFEFHATSKFRHRRNESRNVTDRAPWVAHFLNQIGLGNAKHIRKAKIVLYVYGPGSSYYHRDYTPSIKAIIDQLVLYCSFQITERYDRVPAANVPVSSVGWDPVSRKHCFHITLQTDRSSQLIVEIRTGWRVEMATSLEHATQLHVAREIYQQSVRGQRIRIDSFGTISKA